MDQEPASAASHGELVHVPDERRHCELRRPRVRDRLALPLDRHPTVSVDHVVAAVDAPGGGQGRQRHQDRVRRRPRRHAHAEAVIERGVRARRRHSVRSDGVEVRRAGTEAHVATARVARSGAAAMPPDCTIARTNVALDRGPRRAPNVDTVRRRCPR